MSADYVPQLLVDLEVDRRAHENVGRTIDRLKVIHEECASFQHVPQLLAQAGLSLQDQRLLLLDIAESVVAGIKTWLLAIELEGKEQRPTTTREKK